jgi:hypothetical protein
VSDAFQRGAFQGDALQEGAPQSSGTVGTFDTGIFDRNIFDNVLGPTSSNITGTLAVTLGAVTVSSVGNLPIDADAAITLGSVTVSSAGNLPIDADAAITLAAVALSSAGKVTVDSDASITPSAVTLSSAGALVIDADASITLGAVALLSAGTVGSSPINGTADITLGDIILLATGSGPSTSVPGPFGYGAAVHRQRDTRWDGIREAREEARRLFDEVPATTPARRKEAAVLASEAVAKVAKTITRPSVTQLPQLDDAYDHVLDDLLQLQAYLAGLIEQEERIKAAQAREAAERWAMIERELAAEAFREEELMVVMALAL